MKKTALALLSFGICVSAFSQGYVPDAWNRTNVFRINKEPAASFMLTYPSLRAAAAPIGIDDVENIYAGDSYKSLNGDWKFFFAQRPSMVKPEFFARDFDDSSWDTIDVPNSWQARGYDTIFYNNTDMEFMYDRQGNQYEEFKNRNAFRDNYKPFIPEEHRQKAVYRREFTLPSDWNGKEIFVKFCGVRSGFNLYVNGKFVGYSEDSFTPAEFNITKFLRRGRTNSMAVEVFKYTTGSYFEMQDMPHMVGIIRDVVLIARPQLHVRDFYAPAKLSDDLKSADIDFCVELKNDSPETVSGAKLSAFLYSADGSLEKVLFAKELGAIPAGKTQTVRADAKFSDSIKLWSPDSPNLYALVIRLQDADGKTLEAVRSDFAFRKFEARGNRLFFNNTPFLIKGSNRHDWSPDKGKAADFKWLKKDAELMKRANINFVRTSHYPNDDKFYMLCSRYGIAVLDECNNETHAFIKAPFIDSDEYLPPLVDRMTNMVMRDRNVPCVMIYSFGNESAYYRTKAHAAMEKAARRLDPTRAYHSEAESHDIKDGRANGTMDFFSPMYGGVDKMGAYLRLENETRPFFFCEYAHAMGNAVGNLKGKWDMIRSNRGNGLNGGFIWDWVDQALYLPRPEDPSKTYLSDGRDWGTKPTRGNFSCNGIILADRSFTAKYGEVQRIYQDIQISPAEGDAAAVKISNEFVSTNLDQFTPRVEVERDGEVIAEKTLDTIPLAPGESKTVRLDLPEFPMNDAGEYFYTLKFFRNAGAAFAPKGSVAARAQLPIAHVSHYPERKNLKGLAPASFSQDAKYITVKAGGVEAKFSRDDANLASYRIGGTTVLTGAQFDIDSALIDNFCGRVKKEFDETGFNSASAGEKSVSVEKDGVNVKVVCRQTLFANPPVSAKNPFEKKRPALENTFIYTIAPDGSMDVCAQSKKINGAAEKIQFPRLGLRFAVAKQFDNVSYFGRGPLANYSDRCHSADVGLYRSKVADWLENFTRPQDTGNREEVRWLSLTDDKGVGVKVESTNGNLPMSVLPYTQQELKSAAHIYQLPPSKGADLRVAWKTCGLGNAACGPNTRPQFNTFFKNSANWRFAISPLKK